MADEKQAIERANPASAVPVGRTGVALQNLDDLLRFAKMCTENGAAPKGMTHQQAAICIQAGLERGLGIMSGLQAGVVINGVLSWRGWAAVGFIQNSPVIVPGTFKSWVENAGTDQAIGYCRAQRRGYSEPFIRSFSVNDAKKAGLWRKAGPWESRPDNMLEWRAIGDMGRFHFGDVLGGMPIGEDVEAGGIGPVEASSELPAKRLPEPPPPVQDPILAELVPASATPGPVIEVVAEIVAEKAADGTLASPAEIEASVDEAFPKSAKDFESRPAPGMPCPRCKQPLNLMSGCDLCGFPGEDLRDRG